MINLERFKSGVLDLTLVTVEEFIDSKIGVDASKTIAWVLTGVLAIIGLGLLIWMGVSFGKMATESDLNERKKKKRHAINILIAAIVVLILTGSVAPIFLAIPLDDSFGLTSPATQLATTQLPLFQ